MATNENDRDKFLFNSRWKDAIAGLPDKSRLLIYEAIIDYAAMGTEPEAKLTATEAMAFSFIRIEMEKNMEAYYARIRRNIANANKRWGQGGEDKPQTTRKKSQCDSMQQEKSQCDSMQQKKSQCDSMQQKKSHGDISSTSKEIDKEINKEINILTDIKEREKEKDEEKEKPTKENEEKKTARVFHKPTVEEVRQRMREMGYTGFTAETFWNFYESKGWLVGRAPMKDWKAALVTWSISDRGRDAPRASAHFPGEDDPGYFEKYKEQYNV